jgi:hypothetical protein
VTLEVALVIGLLLIGLAIPRVLSLWRGRRSEDWVDVVAVFVGKAIGRGLIRALPVLYVIVTASVLFLIVTPRLGTADPKLLKTVVTFFTIAYLAAWLLAIAVLLWNRPSAIVPPHLRGEDGAIAEWRQALRHRGGRR